jgi:maleylpyruvate isomerase
MTADASTGAGAGPTAEVHAVSGMLEGSSARLVRTVDGFHHDDWSVPTLLPEWSRAHLVAHLALNAGGLARALRGLVADPEVDAPRSIYDSDARRDQDIVDLATEAPSDIRARLLGGVTILVEAINAVPTDRWETRVERTPGGRTMRASALPGMRLRELEIHHVDLDAGYTRAQWPLEFSEHLLDAMTRRVRPERPFAVSPSDSARTWTLGDTEARLESDHPVPIVTGTAADVAWWLAGRRAPVSLSCSRGELATIEGW